MYEYIENSAKYVTYKIVEACVYAMTYFFQQTLDKNVVYLDTCARNIFLRVSGKYI